MGILDDEALINQELLHDNTGRSVTTFRDSTWGELILPAPDESPRSAKKGFRILIFASFLLGYLLVEALKEMEMRNPERVRIVGLVTDDPANLKARISSEKRIWRLFGMNKKVELEKVMIESALSSGIPCFTGNVKTESFRKLLSMWNPDAILVCVFGQILDRPMINYPIFGIYNFHPADLLDKDFDFSLGPRVEEIEKSMCRKECI